MNESRACGIALVDSPSFCCASLAPVAVLPSLSLPHSLSLSPLRLLPWYLGCLITWGCLGVCVCVVAHSSCNASRCVCPSDCEPPRADVVHKDAGLYSAVERQEHLWGRQGHPVGHDRKKKSGEGELGYSARKRSKVYIYILRCMCVVLYQSCILYISVRVLGTGAGGGGIDSYWCEGGQK